MDFSGAESLPLLEDLSLIAGNTYIVTWNGVDYTCIAQDIILPEDMDGIPAGTNAGVGIGE
jgi:hypothetical protein